MYIVLFVCVENTFRSILSEAIFNAKAPPGWRAESAGFKLADSINPAVVDLLREIGITLQPKKPRLVTREMIDKASRVITFGCMDQCPAGAAGKSDDWPLHGSTGKTLDQLRGIRDELSRRIEILVGDISRRENR